MENKKISEVSVNEKRSGSKRYSKEELEHKILELHQQSPFYHQVDLGQGILTPGHYGHYLKKVMNHLDKLQFEDWNCLDIGCMDGKMSFEIEERGGKVVAIDQYDRPNMRFCLEVLDSRVTYLTGIKLENMFESLNFRGFAPFDFILNSGVLYHAISPLNVLIDCRRMLKNGGFMVLETSFVDRDDNAMYFQCADGAYSPGTLFFPSKGSLIHMLLFVSFIPLEITTEKDRISILCKAVKPSEMPHVNSYHDRHHFAWDTLQPGAADSLAPLSMPELEQLPQVTRQLDIAGTVTIPPAGEIVMPGTPPSRRSNGLWKRLVSRVTRNP